MFILQITLIYFIILFVMDFLQAASYGDGAGSDPLQGQRNASQSVETPVSSDGDNISSDRRHISLRSDRMSQAAATKASPEVRPIVFLIKPVNCSYFI